MNAKDKVSVTDSIEVEVTRDDAILASLTSEQLAAVRKKFGSRVNSPCPKCGHESKRHQGPDGEDRKNKLRICSNRACRTVFEGA
jgi:hypothetical protein